MTTAVPPTPLSQAGAEADAVLKPKITVRIWVVAAIALAANVVGAVFHI